ncbi:hypothetical protein F4677DRAFT_244873 [Hypoxylon crocopeplum]|nr:hypothetical protein F4677DRAFT_244873 [Hypoxylon crocopeplum]
MASIAALSFYLALSARSAYAQDTSYDRDFDGTLWEPWEGYRGDVGGSGGTASSDGYGSGVAAGGFNSFTGFDVGQAMRQRTAHGVIAALCFVVLFPVGAILVRIVPSRHAWLAHAVTQCVTFVLYIAAAGLGLHLVNTVRIPPRSTSLLEMASTNAHPIIGIVILVVLFLQPPLGFIHHRQFNRLKRRTIFSHAHIWLGRAVVTLGIINGGLGLRLANAPRDAVTAYSVVAAIAWLIWFFAAVFGESQRRRQNRDRDRSRSRDISPRPPRMDDFASRHLAPGVPLPHPSRTRRNPLHRYTPSSDDPSPPYTPGPLYGGPPVYTGTVEGDMVEMQPIKMPVERSSSMSSISSRRTEIEVPRGV